MKNKKGFTLVELMAVIIIISLVAILTFPNIINQIKKSKKATTNNINDIVISAAKRYVSDNPDKYNSDDYYIPISELVDNDYVKEDIVNSKDNDITDKYVIYLNEKYSIGNLYTKLEYLESTGFQAIPTDIYIRNTDVVETTILDTKLSLNWENWFGAVDNQFGIVRRGSASNQIEFEINKKYKYITFPINNIKLNIKVDIPNSNFYCNDSNAISFSGLTSDFIQADDPIYLFTKIDSNNRPNYELPGSFKLYNFSVTDSKTGEYRYKLIPVLDYNDEPCLYDTVSGNFYRNETSTPLLYG